MSERENVKIEKKKCEGKQNVIWERWDACGERGGERGEEILQ